MPETKYHYRHTFPSVISRDFACGYLSTKNYYPTHSFKTWGLFQSLLSPWIPCNSQCSISSCCVDIKGREGLEKQVNFLIGWADFVTITAVFSILPLSAGSYTVTFLRGKGTVW